MARRYYIAAGQHVFAGHALDVDEGNLVHSRGEVSERDRSEWGAGEPDDAIIAVQTVDNRDWDDAQNYVQTELAVDLRARQAEVDARAAADEAAVEEQRQRDAAFDEVKGDLLEMLRGHTT